MITLNNNSPVVYRSFRDLNLLDFGLKIVDKKSFKSYINGVKSDLEVDELGKFIELSYNYANCFLKKYSSRYSKHLYSQPALFTILSLKIYFNMTYRKKFRFAFRASSSTISFKSTFFNMKINIVFICNFLPDSI